MKSSSERHSHFNQFSTPTPDQEGYTEFMNFAEKHILKDTKENRKWEKLKKEVSSIWKTQVHNGVDFVQNNELRFFLNEFNDRTWKFGFGALPSSFNILEGFFIWRPQKFYFELLEEEEYLFSVFDFFDFVTSSKCSHSLKYFIENVENETIYNFNILSKVKDLTFRTSDLVEYVLGGVSFVRRNNEIFMLLVAGEVADLKKIEQSLPNVEQNGKRRSYITPAQENEEVRNLFGRDDIWKVNIYLKIDLNSKTIDSRYIQKDLGNKFLTYTDDFGMFEKTITDKETLKENIKHQSEQIKKYEAIFEAAYNCLYLPEYFDFYDKNVKSEDHPTHLIDKSLRKPLSKEDVKFHSKYFFKNKEIWTLDRGSSYSPEGEILHTTELQIQKSGFWRRLEPGKLGVGKNGESIHGRTWVEKMLSWQESDNERNTSININSNSSKRAGSIYLMRNAAHAIDIFKIGLTTKTAEKRAKQLSGTPSPDNFLIINQWDVQDCFLAEKLIHDKLKQFRFNPKREFFKVKIEIAISLIIPIIEKVNE